MEEVVLFDFSIHLSPSQAMSHRPCDKLVQEKENHDRNSPSNSVVLIALEELLDDARGTIM